VIRSPRLVAAPPVPARVRPGEIEVHCRSGDLWPLLGADEAGRGPLAGPVVAAAVVLDDAAALTGGGLQGLDDSKKLTEAARQALVPAIERAAAGWAVEFAEVDEIAAHNILGASLRAMARAARRAVAMAVAAGHPAPVLWVIDGNQPLRDAAEVQLMLVVQGDGRSRAVAAASVLAKVARDRHMQELDVRFPGYGLARHKGYPTAEHLDAVRRLGPSPCHRLGYAPVAQAAHQLGLFG